MLVSNSRSLDELLKSNASFKMNFEKLLTAFEYHYPDRHILFDFWEVTQFEGKAYPREKQPLKWVTLDELAEYNFPKASHIMINHIMKTQFQSENA